MKVNCTFKVEINGQSFDLTKEQAEELYKALKNALGHVDKPINPQRLRENTPWKDKEVYPLPQVWCNYER